MEQLDGILKLVDRELESVVENGKFRSREEIHSVYELMDIVKDAYEIWCMEEEMEGGEEGMSSASYRDGRGRGSYYEEGSYERRGRGRNARRDSRGRYAREGSYREGSYREGRRGSYYREGGKEEFASELRELMQDAPDQQTRQQIQQMLQQIEQ